MKICLLSNTNCDLIVSNLKKKYELFETEGYGQWVSYSLVANDNLIIYNPKVIIVLLNGNDIVSSFDDIDYVKNELISIKNTIEMLANNYSNSIIVVSTIDFYNRAIKENNKKNMDSYYSVLWNDLLDELVKNNKSIVKFDLKEIVEFYGRKQVYADNMLYMGSIPYSIKGNSLIAEELDKVISRLFSTRKKVLAVDLDNTLWGGVIGEDGPNNIVISESNLGRAFRDTQKRIKEIADTGVLLSVISKNNQEDADLAFNENKFMVLQKSDFISFKCNWEPKSKNIIELASELNVGLDSIVFLDDNEVEREEVRHNAPGVVVADFPKDIANLPETIKHIYEGYFWINSLTEEDSKKKKQYEENYVRNEELKNSSSLEEYLINLKINIEINELEVSQKERVIQLINKTNQFNTNTIRMDMQELNSYISNNGKVFVANVSDKYGDNGLVVIALISIKNDNTAIIDNFLMSCRVMSRQIEDAFLYAIEEKLESLKIEKLYASYVKSSKNKPVEMLYERLGFELIECNEDKKSYYLKLPYLQKPLLEYKWR